MDGERALIVEAGDRIEDRRGQLQLAAEVSALLIVDLLDVDTRQGQR